METIVQALKRMEWSVMVFDFSGELDETNADKTFKMIYEEIWDFGWKKIIFNMKELKYLNSKSIWYIADVFSNIEDSDWEMYITDCDEWVKDVLELVWITTIIPTVDREAEALEQMK